MSDLIERKDAIDYFVTNIGVVDEDGYAVDDYDERVKIWTERFSGIPSAEPERKKGRWIYDTERVTDGLVHSQYHCSNCGIQIFGWIPNYCQYCGADMRGE